MSQAVPQPPSSHVLAVQILKESPRLQQQTKLVLKPSLIDGIVEAERKRLGRIEIFIWDFGGVGPGQMYKPAFQDVLTTFGRELELYVLAVLGSRYKDRAATVIGKLGFRRVVTDPCFAPFFTIAYLAICVDRSQRSGRSPTDALAYGIALYRGGRPTVVRAQTALAEQAEHGEMPTDYPSVQSHMQGSGDPKMRALAVYVSEVMSSWRQS